MLTLGFDLCFELLNCLTVLLLPRYEELVLLPHVLIEFLALLLFKFVLVPNLLVLRGPILGAHLDCKVFVLDGTMLFESVCDAPSSLQEELGSFRTLVFDFLLVGKNLR